jgi:hypothetical protein
MVLAKNEGVGDLSPDPLFQEIQHERMDFGELPGSWKGKDLETRHFFGLKIWIG